MGLSSRIDRLEQDMPGRDVLIRVSYCDTIEGRLVVLPAVYDETPIDWAAIRTFNNDRIVVQFPRSENPSTEENENG
jgi:hypothetical protein